MTRLHRCGRSRLVKVLNYEDARERARRVLPRGVFDYVDGGAEDGVTLRRNVAAFRDLGFRPRMGVLVPEPVLETTLFGETVSMPLLTAPCGGMRLVQSEGDLGVARGAAASGTIHVASALSGYTLEEIAQAPGPKWFQLYRFGGREGTENLVERAQASGYKAMVVTVDSTVAGKREKDSRNGFSYSMRVNARNAVRLAPQLLPRPMWVLAYVRHGMPFEMANTAGMTRDGAPLLLSEMGNAGEVSYSPSWEDFEWIRDSWDGPLLIKGLLTGEDSRRAVDAGCDGIVVSNHGGRQLEAAPATIDVLPEVVAAVGNTATVLLDGGVRRGGDVLKAIALGAKAVLIGRPYVWGLAIAGQAGVEHVLAQFRSEMARTMQLMGCESVHKLDPTWVTYMDSRLDSRLRLPADGER